MARRNNKRNNNEKNIIVKTIEQQSRRNPRPNFRARLSDDVSFITGNQYLTPPVVTATNTLGYGNLPLAPGNTGGFATSPVEAVANRYQNGLYLPGTRLDYIPAVGLSTKGTLAVAYIDSPTLMTRFFTLVPGAQLAFIQGLANVKTGPLWQPLTFPLPPNTRRKDYTVDNTITPTDTNEFDLAVQGIYLWVAYGLDAPSSNLTIGQMILHTKMRCRELVGYTQ